MSELLSSLKAEWQLARNGSIARAPLYHQLYSVLKAAILDGTIAYGAQMPTEQQLAKKFEVSRITAKRAMDELAAEKLVTRHRGKGSHVTHHYQPKPVRAPLVGMLENLIEMGKHSIVRAISVEIVVPPADIRAILGLGEKDTVHRTVRVSSNEDGEPYAYYVSWTVGNLRGFTRRRLEANTRLDLLRQNDIQLTRVEQFLSAENATLPIAEELEIEPGKALLSIRRLGAMEDGKVIDVIDALYNPDRYQYGMLLSLNDNGG